MISFKLTKRAPGRLLSIGALPFLLFSIFLSSCQKVETISFSTASNDAVKAKTIDYQFQFQNDQLTLDLPNGETTSIDFGQSFNLISEESQTAEVNLQAADASYDLKLYTKDQKHVAYDFILKAGIDPSNIQMEIKDHQGLSIDETGNLLIALPGGKIRHSTPFSYQIIEEKTVEIESKYHINGDKVGFLLGDHNDEFPVVIDPEIKYMASEIETAELTPPMPDPIPNDQCSDCTEPDEFDECSFTIPNIPAHQTYNLNCENLNWGAVVGGSDDDSESVTENIKIVGPGTVTLPKSLKILSNVTVHVENACIVIEGGSLLLEADDAKFVLTNSTLRLATGNSGDIQLIKAGNVFYGENSTVLVENGNIQVKSEDDLRFIFKDGVIRTKGNFQQDADPSASDKLSTVCITDSEVEVGDEKANGTFSVGVSTGANFQNNGGQRYLKNVCLNVTEDMQLNSGGTDYLINVCAEIGDSDNGSDNGHHFTNLGNLSDDETGSYDIAEGNSHIIGSNFIVAENIIFQTGNTKVCDVSYANLNGNFQVKSGHTLEGCGLCLWIVDGNIQNDGSWTATVFGYDLEMGGSNYLTGGGDALLEGGTGVSNEAFVVNCFDDCCDRQPECDLEITQVEESICFLDDDESTSQFTLDFTVSFMNNQCGTDLTVQVKDDENNVVYEDTFSPCSGSSKDYSVELPADATSGTIMVTQGICMVTETYTAPGPCDECDLGPFAYPGPYCFNNGNGIPSPKPAADGNGTYSICDEDGQVIVGGVNAITGEVIVSDLEPGDYIVKYLEDGTGCSAEAPITIIGGTTPTISRSIGDPVVCKDDADDITFSPDLGFTGGTWMFFADDVMISESTANTFGPFTVAGDEITFDPQAATDLVQYSAKYTFNDGTCDFVVIELFSVFSGCDDCEIGPPSVSIGEEFCVGQDGGFDVSSFAAAVPTSDQGFAIVGSDDNILALFSDGDEATVEANIITYLEGLEVGSYCIYGYAYDNLTNGTDIASCIASISSGD
ncbi:MAG: hypothetical protein AAF901_08910, partial [Bacteroidota bacterium]